MKNILIVHYDSNKINLALLIMPIVIAGLIFLLVSSFNLKTKINYYLLILMQTTLVIAILFFLIGLIYSYFFKHNEPAAILSSDGIWIKRHGLISWDAISDFDTCMIPTVPLEILGISLKNPDIIATQSSFEGKCGLFWAKLFGYQYHITLSSLAIENDEVLVFARQFLQ
jgi:hypothetical protein